MSKVVYLLLLLAVFAGCKKLYNPTLVKNTGNYLVVEGVINTGNDSTIFTLSRTVAVEAKSVANPVTDAVVTVESEQNGSWPLTYLGAGRYGAPALNLSTALRYRLRVKTADGLQYLSDLVTVQQTPPIDSVGYLAKSDGIQVYVSTHDPANKTRFYRWSYEETWIFSTEYQSFFLVDTIAHKIVLRQSNQYVLTCFGNDISTNIFVFSTAPLSKAVVYQNPLIDIAYTSEKLEKKYSILVRQYGMTAEAYDFYTRLKLNTEQIGGIFDPQPSRLISNIHCVSDTSQVVIGYITAANEQTKRIFLTSDIRPKGVTTIYPYQCGLDSAGASFFFIPPYDNVPIAPATSGYLYSSRECVDCTLRGTTVTPPFWQ